MKRILCCLVIALCLMLFVSCKPVVDEKTEIDGNADAGTNEHTENQTPNESDDADKYPYLNFVARKTSYGVSAKNPKNMPEIVENPAEYNGMPVDRIIEEGFKLCTGVKK